MHNQVNEFTNNKDWLSFEDLAQVSHFLGSPSLRLALISLDRPLSSWSSHMAISGDFWNIRARPTDSGGSRLPCILSRGKRKVWSLRVFSRGHSCSHWWRIFVRRPCTDMVSYRCAFSCGPIINRKCKIVQNTYHEISALVETLWAMLIGVWVCPRAGVFSFGAWHWLSILFLYLWHLVLY